MSTTRYDRLRTSISTELRGLLAECADPDTCVTADEIASRGYARSVARRVATESRRLTSTSEAHDLADEIAEQIVGQLERDDTATPAEIIANVPRLT